MYIDFEWRWDNYLRKMGVAKKNYIIHTNWKSYLVSEMEYIYFLNKFNNNQIITEEEIKQKLR